MAHAASARAAPRKARARTASPVCWCPALWCRAGRSSCSRSSRWSVARARRSASTWWTRENKPFCSVLIAESGPPSTPAFRGLYGILLEHAGEPLAFPHTEDWHAKQSPVCPLYRKDGELFGYLMRDRDPPRRYSIVAPHTGDTLLSFHGDFREQSVNVHNGHGQLVATTERQAFAFALDRYVQVRVAPCVDASLVMLGLLGIAKMEN